MLLKTYAYNDRIKTPLHPYQTGLGYFENARLDVTNFDEMVQREHILLEILILHLLLFDFMKKG